MYRNGLLTISGLYTFKFHVKSFAFLEIWFTACSLWTALEMFFWKNIGNLLYLDPLSTTSSTLRYLWDLSIISSKDDFFCFCRTRRPTQLTSPRSLQRRITISSQYTGSKGILKIQWWLKTLLVHGMGQDLESLMYVTVSCSPGVTFSLWRCVWRRFLRSSSSSSFTELLTRWRTISLSAPKRSSRTTMLLYTRLSWKILSSKYFLMIERSSMRC